MARPIPRVPPVTAAIFPVNDSIFELYALVRMTTGLRQILEQQIAKLLNEAEGLFAHERDAAIDRLNQAVRRIRQADGPRDLAATLADAASASSSGAIVFSITNGTARAEEVRGAPPDITGLEIPLSSAAALAEAVESRDPVTAIITGAEVSGPHAEPLGQSPAGLVSVFPIVVKGRVPALLYAWGKVEGSALELLTQVASTAWVVPEPELVTIVTNASAPRPALQPGGSWDSLPAEEQRIHLQAQRFARVRAAEMRLHHSGAVQAGRARGDLYETLRQPIDQARETFRQSFFSTCPSMVDYLHLELVRTLANDDAEQLGKTYPGPLV